MTWNISIQTISKVAAISIGAAVLAMAAEQAARQPWTSVGAWLRPPYIHVIVNGIIISIAAASRFRDHQADELEKSSAATSVEEYRDDNQDHHRQVISLDRDRDDEEIITVEVKEVIKEADHDHHDHEAVMMMKSMSSMDILPKSTVEEEDTIHLSTEKHLIPAKVTGHRKPAKPIATLEGGLRVSKPKVQHVNDTLENTWKAITEGRSTPLSRQMKKCENNHDRQMTVGPPVLKKSETFKDMTNHQVPAVPSTLLRRDTSLSHDELNSRVEAFIKKFNEDMRLQRQESLNQYMDMINRGAQY